MRLAVGLLVILGVIPIIRFKIQSSKFNEAPAGLRPGYLLPVASSGAESLRSETSSLSSTSSRWRFFAKGDKTALEIPTVVPTVTAEPKRFVQLDVPFTSQAPYGEWSDPRHQDGCEEAAVLMAMAAISKDSRFKIQGSILDKSFAKGEIERIWEWEEENYGEARDTNVQDTADRIIGGYFGYSAYSVQRLASSKEIQRELARGNVVIVPADGRGLNPNYTAPGPERHMILIRGYDDGTGEFITNDAGTRKGEKYRYKCEVLFNAIRDYPTGNHVPIVGREKKMIVVSLNP